MHGEFVVVLCAIGFSKLSQDLTLQIKGHYLWQVEQKAVERLLIWTNLPGFPLAVCVASILGGVVAKLFFVQFEEVVQGFVFEIKEHFDEFGVLRCPGNSLSSEAIAKRGLVIDVEQKTGNKDSEEEIFHELTRPRLTRSWLLAAEISTSHSLLGGFVKFISDSASWSVLYERRLVLQDQPLLIQYKVGLLA